MLEAIVNELEENIFPKEGWLRTCLLTFGIGSGTLFLVKYLLSRRRAWCTNNVILKGKVCLVTGANTGIGKAVAQELAKRQAKVILACRDVQKGGTAAIEIKSQVKDAKLEVYKLDLASFDSIRQFAEKLKQTEDSIDILVNNAGLMGCPYLKSSNNIEMHFAVNHLGHFLLTNLLLDLMKDKSDSRIIINASALYKNGNLDLVNYNNEQNYDRGMAYSKSKLANMLFSHELSKRLPAGITVNAMHPGVCYTELARHRLTHSFLTYLFGLIGYFFLRSPLEGAQTIIYLATEPSLKHLSGKYFGDCKIEEPLQKAMDDKMSEKLWEVSEKLTSL